MKRKEYQEKFVKIKKIKEDTEEILCLFEELKDEVKTQDKSIQTIDDNLSLINEDVKIAEIELKESDSYSKMGLVIGGGIGAVAFLYSPIVGSLSVIAGASIGLNISKFLKLS